MKKPRAIVMAIAALAAAIGFAGNSASFLLDTMEGTRIARDVETIAYSTEWSDGGSVCVSVDGVTLKSATAPASGDVIWNAAKAGVGRHTLTHTCGGETLTAQFEVQGYTIRYEANDGSGFVTNITVAAGTEYTIEDIENLGISWEGHFFQSWAFVGSDGETHKYNPNDTITVDADITFVGDWNYALKFDANASDATGTMYDMSVAYGEPVSLPVCMFEREGYFFVGWSTNPNVWAPSLYNCETRTFDYDFGGVYRPGDTWWIGEDSLLPDGVTLYAVWGKNYTVRLRKNKGEIYEADDVIVSLAYGDVLPQNPFGLEVINGRSDTFIGWATSASLSELDECLYEEGSLWDGDGELPGSEVILYAVWGHPVSYTFYNDNNSVPSKLEPQGLEKLIKWRCKCWYSHWHPEGVGVWHDGSETIFLPPGNHEIEFSCAPAADEWVNADSLKNGDVLTIPLINGENGNPAWQWTFSRDIHRYVDLSLPNAVKVRFNYSLMYSSGATTEEFDESLAKIRLKFYGGEEMYEVKAGSVVPLELDRSYTADFSYEGGWLSAWIGSPINFKPRDLKPDPLGVREVTGYFIRVQESGFGEGQYLIDLYSDANESRIWTLTVSIGDWIYLPKFMDKDGKKFSGWFTKPDWFGRRRKIENNFAEVTKDFLESIKHEYEDGGHSYELHARWDTSIPSIIGGWFSSVINSESAISVSLPSTTVGIHASAFVGCENVEEVVFEGNAPEVESGAFDGLSSDCVIYVRRDSTGWGVDIPGTWNGRRIEYIEYVEEDEPATSNPIFTIEDGVLTAVDLNGATEVTIPEGAVTEIDYGAFKDLTSMISVAIPASVDYIHVWAFDGCSGLTNITVSEGNACYKSVNGLLLTKDGETLVQGVNGDVAIPFGVTTIGDSAFYGCSGLSSVDISDSVIIIDDYAFGECSGLTSVVMPVGMTSIGTWAFGGCVGLTSVTIPDSVTSIGESAFEDCGGLMNVTIGASVTNIDDYAFFGCYGLVSVTFCGNAPAMGDGCFEWGPDASCVVQVNKGSTGWGVDIPGTWNGMRIEYLTMEPVAANASPATVTNAIESAGFADAEAVKAAIGGSAEKYAAFKSWAGSVKGAFGGAVAGESAVVANTNAAAAFMLGAERLFENAPRIEFWEVAVRRQDGGSPGQGGDGGAGSQGVTVSVVVKDSENAVRCAAEKVKELFEATRELGDWEGESRLTPMVDVLDGDGETMRFRVTPGDGKSSSAFLRIRK